jgi:hypothetical protein
MIDMENLVRQVMTEQTEDLDLGRDAASRALRAAARRRGRRRLGLIAASCAAFAVAGTGIAAATGVMPWWMSHTSPVDSSPIVTSPDPAAVAGSIVQFTAPGPESSTFEIVTGTPATVGAVQVTCTVTAVKDAQGRSQHVLESCKQPGMLDARGATVDWQAPSGTLYAVFTGPAPTATAAKVAVKDSHGVTAATGPVGNGYYLVWASAEELSQDARTGVVNGSLVFYDASGQVVDEWALDPHP